ncbi:hypothetical protein [Rhizobium sp. CSW-27]|nr:hypothetical protein [Rhizobium sp. CSW-27]
MNSATFFFLYLLPFVIAGAGWIAVVLNERSAPKDRMHPGE